MARPAKYDEDLLIRQATDLFWEKGYRGVSIGDLTSETGVLAGSLYCKYGNKEGLYLACIDHYAAKSTALCERLEAEHCANPLKRVEAFLEHLMETSLEDSRRRGCFFVNAVIEMAPQCDCIATAIRSHTETTIHWLEVQLEASRADGLLIEAANAELLAECIYSLLYSIQIKIRFQEDAEKIREHHASMMSLVLDPWRVPQT